MCQLVIDFLASSQFECLRTPVNTTPSFDPHSEDTEDDADEQTKSDEETDRHETTTEEVHGQILTRISRAAGPAIRVSAP